MGKARRQRGAQQILLDNQGTYHLVQADSFKGKANAIKSGRFDSAVVAFENSGKVLIRENNLGPPDAQLVALLLQGDKQLDKPELRFLVNHIAGLPLSPQNLYLSRFREAVVEAMTQQPKTRRKGTSAYDAWLSRLLQARSPDATDMAILNLVAASQKGGSMLVARLEKDKMRNGLLNVTGRRLVERLVDTPAGRTLLAKAAKGSEAQPPSRAMERLRMLSSSAAGRRFFLHQLVSQRGSSNPFVLGAGMGIPMVRPEVKEYLAMLQQMVPDLLKELVHPEVGLVDTSRKLTPAGRRLIWSLDRSDLLRADLELLQLNSGSPYLLPRDYAGIQTLASTREGRARLERLLDYFTPEVAQVARGTVDSEVRRIILTTVHNKLRKNRYSSAIQHRRGQLNRGGPDIDCYDAAWDIISALQNTRNALAKGDYSRVSGLTYPSRRYKRFDQFLEQLRVGDVLYLGPPSEHWVVYIGKDRYGVPQIMHGNSAREEYVPDGQGETERLPVKKMWNRDSSLVITSIEPSIKRFRRVRRVYRPLVK